MRPLVGPILGVQRLSLQADAPTLLEIAVHVGFSWVDVADVYGHAPGDAERLVAGIAGNIGIITKGGLVRQGTRWVADGRAAHLERAVEASLQRLGRIDLYLLHAPDPKVDVRTSARALRRLVDRGLVGAIGACNLRVHQLAAMCELAPIAAVQVELSPFSPQSVRSGIVEACQQRQIPVLAHRPLGGDAIRRLRRDPVLGDVARRHDATVEEVTLAWLASLGTIPVPGPTRAETVRSCARKLDLGDDVPRLDAEFVPGRLRVRTADRRPTAPDGDVVMIVGSPGAGKSTRVSMYVAQGYARLNRDERGGRLDDLLPELDRLLVSGERRVVLDNTYATRASRNGVVEVAWARGASARAEAMETSADDCEVNLVHRILDTVGTLPGPHEIERYNATHPAVVPPRALTRYRDECEPLDPGEGLHRIDRIPFVRTRAGNVALMLLDPRHLVDGHRDALRAAASRGVVLAVIGWDPGNIAGERAVREQATSLGVDVDVAICPHPAGAPVCWCRKPLVGLAVAAMRRHGADLARSVVVDLGPTERTLARKLGLRVVATPGEV